VFGNAFIKHLPRVEPLHDDEPVNDRSASANRQPFGRRHQRRHVEIDIGCEPPIQPKLRAASGFALGQG